MRRKVIDEIIQRHGFEKPFTVITVCETRHHGHLDHDLIEEEVLIVRPNSDDTGMAYIATEHIVALLP